MEELYNQLYKDGKYTKTFEDFQNQFGTPEKSEKLYIALNEAGDYTKSFDDFKAQFVLAGKTNDSVIADPNAESEKNDTGSKSEVGFLESFDDTQEKLTWVEKIPGIGKNVVTDFLGDIGRAWQSGWAQGGAVDPSIELWQEGPGISDEKLNEFIEAAEKMNNAPLTDEMIQRQKDYEADKKKYGGVAAWFTSWAKNPTWLTQVFLQSMGNIVKSATSSEEALGVGLAGAGTAAGAVALAGQAGPQVALPEELVTVPSAAIGGFMGGISGVMETGLTTAELLKEELEKDGKEINAANIRALMDDEKRWKDITSKAVKRGAAIGVIDGITGAVSGGVGKAVTTSVGKRAGAAALGTIETAGGMLSETLGQLAADQDINIDEILTEGFADKSIAVAQAPVALFGKKASYSINGEKMNGYQFRKALSRLDDEALIGADIQVNNDDVMSTVVKTRRQDLLLDTEIDSKVSDVTDRAKLINLEKDLNKLKDNKTRSGQAKRAKINQEIDNILNKYEGAEVDVTIDNRKKAILAARDAKVESLFEKYKGGAVELAEKLGFKEEPTVFDSTDDYIKAIAKDQGIDIQKAKSLAEGSEGAFIGKGKIFIDKQRAKKVGAVSVAMHEILHPILNATIGNAKNQAAIVSEFKKAMTSNQRKWVESQLRKNVDPSNWDTEYLNYFSDGILRGEINYDRTTFEKIKDIITRILKGKGFNNISFDSGRDVYNFLKEYNTSVQKTGKVSERAIEAIKAGEEKAGRQAATVGTVAQMQLSKTQLEGVKKRLSDIPAADVESRVNVNKISAELPAMIGTQINNRFSNLDPDTREEFTFDVLEKILRPNKEGVNKDLQWDGRGELYGFLNGRIGLRIRDAVREDYKRPAAERMYVGRIDAKQLEDLTREPATEPTTETTTKKKTAPKEESVERGQATFDELDIVDDALIKDIKSELEKEIRVRVQKGTLSETVSIKKGRNTYIVSWLEDYINKQLFKKLLKKVGAIKGTYPNTVIPPAYIDFLQDPKTFDIITKALPIKSIKKSYGKLFDIERIGREETAEGNPIFRIKKIDKTKFFKYFVDGKKSTILERQKQLFREILTPVAKQIVADYTTPENLANLKAIQELAPDTSLDVQKEIILEAQLNELESQLDRYKGEKTGFDIIQFSKNVSQEQKDNIKVALTPLLDKPSNNDFKDSVVLDILNGLENVKTFKDLANLIWNAGNTTLSITSIREYRAELLSLLANKLNYTDTVKFLISAINEYQKVYKYQQKVIGYDYALADLKSSLNEAKETYAKADVAENFLKYISRSIRTLKINNITKNSNIYDKILVPILGDPKKYGFSLKIDDKKNRSYILRNGKVLYGLTDVTRIKAHFEAYSKQINDEALEVRKWLISKAKKAKASKDIDSFIGLLSLISADQRGVIRKMNRAGFAFKNLKVADSVLEHETEAFEVFNAWKDFAQNKISETELNKFLDGAVVNLVPKELDNILKKVQKEQGLRGKERYNTKEVKDYIAKAKDNIIQFSLNSATNIEFQDNEAFAGSKSGFFTINGIEYVGALTGFNLARKDFVNAEPLIEKLQQLTGKKNVETEKYQVFTFDRNDAGAEIVSRAEDNAEWNGKRWVYPESDTKQSLAVFGSLSNYFLNEIEKGNLDGLVFSGREPSRQRLYNALSERFAKKLGWNYGVIEKPTNRGGNTYFIAKPAKIQFSKTKYNWDPFDMADVVTMSLFGKTKAFQNREAYMRTYKYLTPAQQAEVRAEMKKHKLLQFSKTVNKAKAMINRPDAPQKGISIWDFDDTLATTKSNVLYTMPDGTKGKIDATQFAAKGDQLAAKGAEFDFSEFKKVMEGAKGPMFNKAVARNKKFGNDNVFILTARPADSKYAIHDFLSAIGLNIKIENIVGLGNSTAQAKAEWVIGKVAEGYNDFYFADDAYKNVKAVQEVLEVADVKSKVHQAKVQFSKNLNKEFNKIVEDVTGISAKEKISKARGKVIGKKKGRFKFFIPPSADDFSGLLYKLLGKGKKGEQQQAWFKEALFDPFAKGIREFESYKQNVTTIVNQLKKDVKNIPAGLKKENETGFTNENAVRVYLWAKNGFDIDGLNAKDIKELVNFVKNNPELMDFADQLDALLEGYPEPQNDWLAGTITTDAINMINTTKRAEFLEAWQQNADTIFSEDNLNKLRAAFGDNYVEALQDMLYRMKTGRNRPSGANKLTNRFMNWVNDSVGTIMFFNTRSALLQTLSTVNFINWGDNNPIAAAKAFANQKQFWSDFAMLFNSDFLKQRRSGLKNDVNADDIANAAETATNKTKAVLSSILKMGFLPTQIADSFAIALGGASFVRNRMNTYISEGLSKQEAQEKAFLDFQEIAEETQQSSRPDRISQQQASPLGRIILAFANTPMQYMRLTKKAFLDLKNGRGDAKTNITKIAYYMAVQNIIFSALQGALFAALFDDDDEELDNKQMRVANSMADSILRGVGVYGAAAATLKNIVLEIKRQSDKPRPDFTVAAQRALSISPPIDSKMRKLMSAARAFSYKTTREKMKGYGLDNPAYYAVGQIVSAGTNVPLDRLIRKTDNIRVALDNDTKYWQSVALLLGYSQWDVGLVETSKSKSKKKKSFGHLIKYKPSRLTKEDLIKLKNKK